MIVETGTPRLSVLVINLSMEELFSLSIFVVLFILLLIIAFVEDEEEERSRDAGTDNGEWWEELRQSAHSRLVLPPDAFIRRKQPSGSKFSAKNIKNKGTMIYNKARRMIYNNNREPNTLFNGDISVDNIPAEHIPLLCFVNTKSGGRYGVFAIKELRSLLNPVQVVDLQKSDPLAALQAFSRVPSFRVLVCGGDGSVRWILNCIEQLPRELRPPVAILPLGTGNDLAR